MKRLIASRKLKRTCIHCDKEFKKGDVYYQHREIIKEDDEIHAYEYLVCPRCKYEDEQQNIRFQKFREKCNHPKEFITEEWSYIPGECVKQPDHLECRLCGKWV